MEILARLRPHSNMRNICRGVGLVVVLFLSSCSEYRTKEGVKNPTDTTPEVIPYEGLARAVDQGRIGEFEGKHLRIIGHVRAYVSTTSTKPVLVVGESLPAHEFPTMFCEVSASDYAKAAEFRGSKTAADGIYDSAFPDRVVGIDALFAGRMEGKDIYSAEDCKVMK